MELLDLCYYCCRKCDGLFPTIWEMRAHNASCTGIKVLDSRVHLYAYESVYLNKFVQCCASCAHCKSCPFLLQNSVPPETTSKHEYFTQINSILSKKQIPDSSECLNAPVVLETTVSNDQLRGRLGCESDGDYHSQDGNPMLVGEPNSEVDICWDNINISEYDHCEADSQVLTDGQVGYDIDGLIECYAKGLIGYDAECLFDCDTVGQVGYNFDGQNRYEPGTQVGCDAVIQVECDTEGQVDGDVIDPVKLDAGSNEVPGDTVVQVECENTAHVECGTEIQLECPVECEDLGQDEGGTISLVEGLPEGHLECEMKAQPECDTEIQVDCDTEIQVECDSQPQLECASQIQLESDADTQLACAAIAQVGCETEVQESKDEPMNLLKRIRMKLVSDNKVKFETTSQVEVHAKVQNECGDDDADDDVLLEFNPEAHVNEEIIEDEQTKSLMKGLANTSDEIHEPVIECEVVCDDMFIVSDMDHCETNNNMMLNDSPTEMSDLPEQTQQTLQCTYRVSNNNTNSNAEPCEDLSKYLKAMPTEDMVMGVTMYYVCDMCDFKCIEPNVFCEHLYGSEQIPNVIYYDQTKSQKIEQPKSPKNEQTKRQKNEQTKRQKNEQTYNHKAERKRERKEEERKAKVKPTHSKIKKTSHITKRHSQEKYGKFCCSHCDYTCENKIVFSKHMKGHGRKPYTCSYKNCNYQSIHRWKMKAHRVSIHKDSSVKGMRYACDECDFKCSHRDTIVGHVLDHRGLKLWQCVECGFSNSAKAVVQNHVRNRHVEYANSSLRNIVVRMGQTLDVDIEAYKVRKDCDIEKRRKKAKRDVYEEQLRPDGLSPGDAGVDSGHHLEVLDVNCLDQMDKSPNC